MESCIKAFFRLKTTTTLSSSNFSIPFLVFFVSFPHIYEFLYFILVYALCAKLTLTNLLINVCVFLAGYDNILFILLSISIKISIFLKRTFVATIYLKITTSFCLPYIYHKLQEVTTNFFFIFATTG